MDTIRNGFYFLMMFTASFVYIQVFSGKNFSRIYRTVLLLISDLGFAAFLLHFKDTDMQWELFLTLILIGNILAIRKIILGTDPDQDKYNAWHHDPANWRAGLFYYNPLDKRIFPPKKQQSFGWTVNFANPFSILAILALILLIIILAQLFS